MKVKSLFVKKIFYLDNACRGVGRSRNSELMKKVEEYVKRLKPRKIWKEVGLFNKKARVSVFPDFVLLLKNKLIACEVERFNLRDKFPKYKGFNFVNELWFFTEIPQEKKHLHYKFKSDLTIEQKFFGINSEGAIVRIEYHPRCSPVRYLIEQYLRKRRRPSL